MSSNEGIRVSPRPVPFLRLPVRPFWRKRTGSPPLSALRPEKEPHPYIKPYISPPSPVSPLMGGNYFSSSPALSSHWNSPSLLSLPDLTRASTRDTLFIKALPPTPKSSPPRPTVLVRKATPYRSDRRRPQSVDTMPDLSPMLLAKRVEAGRMSPKPTQEVFFRRRSSMPNLGDLAAVASGHLAPPLGPSRRLRSDSTSTPSLPHTPSECHIPPLEKADIRELGGGETRYSIASTATSPVSDLPGHTAMIDNQPFSSSSSITEQDARVPAFDPTLDPASDASERIKTLDILEGRSNGLFGESYENNALLISKQSPAFGESYTFQRSRFTDSSCTSTEYSMRQTFQAERFSSRRGSDEEVVGETEHSAVATGTIEALQKEVAELKAKIISLEETLAEKANPVG